MLTWAVDRGQISANHLRGLKRLAALDQEIEQVDESYTKICIPPSSKNTLALVT
jgi:hypothetical protein